MPLLNCTLILGGAASGKSAFAENLVLQSGLRPVYLATAEAHDAEMTAKIARHRDQRSGAGWRTLEEPRAIGPHFGTFSSRDAVLLDCATLWLTNVMLSGGDWEAEAGSLLTAIAASAAPVVVVSNETGAGIVPETTLGRRFRSAQGLLNQRLAAASDLVVAVMAGLPLVLKGRLP